MERRVHDSRCLWLVRFSCSVGSYLCSFVAGLADRASLEGMVNDAEKALAIWDASLPDHLRFSEESLQLQLSMYDTSSNAGAWSYFMTHIIHTACVLMVYDVSLPYHQDVP